MKERKKRERGMDLHFDRSLVGSVLATPRVEILGLRCFDSVHETTDFVDR
jgi:hypothetical protein